MITEPQPRRIGVVLKGYPRLSETFIAQEIRELERLGSDLEIISLRHPTDKDIHPVHREIAAPVRYLPEYLFQEPQRVIRAWWKVRKLPGYSSALRAFLKDLRRDMTPNRIRRFGQAMVLAAEYADRLDLIYVHFIHTPGSVARYAALMTGLHYAISAHAKDIWTTPAWELREKLDSAEWCVTCTKGGAEELRRHAGDPGKVHLVYHGIDLARFTDRSNESERDGSDPANPVRLLTVGRAVGKKGIDTLIAALGLLPTDLNWHWQHIGGGPLHRDLVAQAESLAIADKCQFRGALAQSEVIAAYRQADLFVLPCRIDETGDRDGLPNVLVEAQSQSVAVLTTPVSGIPELIEPDFNGMFVDPDDPVALAEKINLLSRDPKRRKKLGANGERRVRAEFDHHATIPHLSGLLRETLDRLSLRKLAA